MDVGSAGLGVYVQWGDATWSSMPVGKCVNVLMAGVESAERMLTKMFTKKLMSRILQNK